MTLQEMKKNKAEAERRLKLLRGCGSSGMVKKARKDLKEYIERISFSIWKIENPESFENHEKTLSDFIESGCYSMVMQEA